MRPYYYVRTREKIDIALADMFDDLLVFSYTNAERTEWSQYRRIPLVLSPDAKFAQWFKNQQQANVALPVPIGSLKLDSLAPNPSERVQPYARSVLSETAWRIIEDATPAPFTLTYSLEFLTTSNLDANQIIENIAPYFNIDRCLRIREFDFAPEFERQIPVKLASMSFGNKEDLADNKGYKLINPKFTFELKAHLYLPIQIQDIIKYAELRLNVDQFTHPIQYIPYPDEIAGKIRKPWETIAPSARRGFSILTNMARTLWRVRDERGKVIYLDQTPKDNPWGALRPDLDPVHVPDAGRPVGVPSFDLLHLDYDDPDMAREPDRSGFGRDFIAVNPNNPANEYVSPMPPGSGKSQPEGWMPAAGNTPPPKDGARWSRILEWFGTADGLMEDSLTFQSVLRFTESPVPDCIFQYLSNLETQDANGNAIPAGKVWFEWGMMGGKLYFSFQTFGTKAIRATYETSQVLSLNTLNTYRFVFALYDRGNSGMFAMGFGADGDLMVLDTVKAD